MTPARGRERGVTDADEHNPESIMLKTTVFTAIHRVRSTAGSPDAGRHRGRPAEEGLTALHLPGHGKHRRTPVTEPSVSTAKI
ncbi:hypothetical protein [Streptomyces cadmiisoli]|uniref:Uncharacterized protein n=1 Tax=Streptomyces cadmiisoli TaxID=2184053 RepID=A0A2Z4J9I1_9ACTN|nr:hypothetical protein [Streptomyces cadmiisoli]AWW41765.1 hypothetical protein DN051_38265 [Streptomyces cadmiisoli]